MNKNSNSESSSTPKDQQHIETETTCHGHRIEKPQWHFFLRDQNAHGFELGMFLDQSLIWKARQVRSNAGAVIQFRTKEGSTNLDITEPMYIVGASWEGNACKQMWVVVGQVGSEDWLQWFDEVDNATKFHIIDVGSGRSALTSASYGSDERGIRVNFWNGEVLLDQSDMCFGLSCEIVAVKSLNDNIKP